MGQGLSRWHFPDPEAGGPAEPAAKMAELYDQLLGATVKCPISQKKFVPPNVLNKMVTPESVRGVMHSAPTLFTRFCGGDRAEEVVQKAQKVFAILVLAGCQTAIWDLLEEGLTDEHLPLRRRNGNADRILVSEYGGKLKQFRTFQSLAGPQVTSFLDHQWLVPELYTGGEHFVLGPHSALPLQDKLDLIGGTGKVYRCALHPSYYKRNSKTDEVRVAIKELNVPGEFTQEKENLNKVRELDNPHLIKHIATCEIRNAERYFIIFPLADEGSLQDYWMAKSTSARTPDVILWSLQQMLGLAKAVDTLHYGLGSSHCRHGDLKPANILLFEEGGERLLVIADLGVSRIHDKPTAIRTSGTNTKATTLAYQAPEAHDHPGRQFLPRSRRYDLWSLGCVFLEFSIWLLYDHKAVDNFEERRYDGGANPNASFYVTNSDSAHAVVCPQVKDAVDALRADERCKGTALDSLVSFVAERLLVINPKGRCEAKELKDELERIVTTARKDRSYLIKEANPPFPIANVFLPVHKAAPRRGSITQPM